MNSKEVENVNSLEYIAIGIMIASIVLVTADILGSISRRKR